MILNVSLTKVNLCPQIPVPMTSSHMVNSKNSKLDDYSKHGDISTRSLSREGLLSQLLALQGLLPLHKVTLPRDIFFPGKLPILILMKTRALRSEEANLNKHSLLQSYPWVWWKCALILFLPMLPSPHCLPWVLIPKK